MKEHVIRLTPGKDLKKSITSFAKEKNINAGCVLTCVGSLKQYKLRFANQKNANELTGYFEILSLSGTISRNGCHLHMSIADKDGITVGGHLLDENIIYTTAEIVIGEIEDLVFTREPDDSTGWPELKISGIQQTNPKP